MNQTPLSAVCCIGILVARYSPHLIVVMLLEPVRVARVAVGESERTR